MLVCFGKNTVSCSVYVYVFSELDFTPMLLVADFTIQNDAKKLKITETLACGNSSKSTQ